MNSIRNFAIVAHIDHGKSTLADRLLEETHTVSKREMQEQLLDSNPIERERGITIKLAPVRMIYNEAGQNYIFNLIDTPGHVDFSYEVSRSLAACEGVILLVDSTQGVQAQTLAHYQQAIKQNLAIVPVINKIDVSTANVAETVRQMVDVFHFEPDSILKISAKTGVGIPELLSEIVKRIPAPHGDASISSSPRALVFNSSYDPHLGVLAWIRLVDGVITAGQKLRLLGTSAHLSAIEVGFFVPFRKSAPGLSAGEVGYIVTGLRDPSLINVGDTLTSEDAPAIQQLPGYQPIKPVVFVSFYPLDGAEINLLRDALDKLKLQDSSIAYQPEFSPALGNGFRLGLLGLLHADIVQERLEREFNIDLIAVAPSVEYEVLTTTGEIIHISRAMDLPDMSFVREIREPVLLLNVFVPVTYVGATMQLCQNHRGVMLDMTYLGSLVRLTYQLPLVELIRKFYDQLKSVSQGFATLDYEIIGFVPSDLIRLDILISQERIDSLSQIVPKFQSQGMGRQLVERLKEIIPRQQYEVVIQAAIGSHVVARADLKAFRKDVTAKLYGGDQTRKDKLLKKQKKGKARMKRVGKVDLPQEAFLSILKID